MNYPSKDHVTPTHTNAVVESDHMVTGTYYARKYPHGAGLQYDIMKHVGPSHDAWIGSAVSYEAAITIARALNEQARGQASQPVTLEEAASAEEARRAAADPR